jgi:hypothetical protein
MFISEFSNTSLDALYIRLDEVEFVLFLFEILFFTVVVVFILLLRFIVRIVVIVTWVGLDKQLPPAMLGSADDADDVDAI